MGIRATLILTVSLLLAACVRTTSTSFTDPLYVGQGPLAPKQILVVADGMGMDEAQSAEGAMARTLSAELGMAVREGWTLFPPTRSYTPEQKADIVEQQGIDGVLVLVEGDRKIVSSYVPPTYGPTQVYGTATTFGNTTYVDATATTYQYGGYTLKKPRSVYQATYVDWTGPVSKVAWTATLKSRGSAIRNFSDLAEDAGVSAARKLIEDGLLAPKR